jgi:hypothetical protein
VRRLGHGSRRFQRKAWEHILGLMTHSLPNHRRRDGYCHIRGHR